MTKGEGMAVTKFAQHELVRLGYEISGEGEPVILVLHGVLQGRITLRPLTDALAERTMVISMDLRGHGGSSAVHGLNLRVSDLAEDAFAVLDAAEVTSAVTIVGVELGAVIASAMRESRPDRVGEVVMVNHPAGEMLDAGILNSIADTAYAGQAEKALTRWLDLSWGAGWQDSIPKPRIAASRRSVEAIHPMLTALAKAEITELPSLRVPGGTPFDEEADLATVLAAIESLLEQG